MMKKTLVLFLDAFSFSDFSRDNCPFMYSLAEKGASGPIRTIPAGYHIEYSMLSGCLPLKHNVWTWYFLKKNGTFSKIKYIKWLFPLFDNLGMEKQKRLFIDIYINLVRLLSGKSRFLKSNRIPLDFLEKLEVSVDKMHFEHNPLPVPTFFDILRNKKVKYTGMEFPVISNNNGSGFYFLKGDLKNLNKAERLLEKNDLVYLHIWDLDAIEHKYGLHSPEALTHLKKVDRRLEAIKKNNPNLNIVIFSDHGGVNIKKTKDVSKILKDFKCEYFLGSTTAQIWLEDLSRLNELKGRLLEEGYLVYDKENIERELHIPYKREFVGDIIAWVKPGEQIFPDFFRADSKVISMHGYSVRSPELDGTFIINGFGISPQKIRDMKLYDIAPTLSKAMNLDIPSIWDGTPRIN